MSELLWIAVPGGLETGDGERVGSITDVRAVVRVVVVPHLGEGDLSDYGMGDWPRRLEDTFFRLQVRSGGRIFGTDRDPVYRPTARSEVWRAFFQGDAGRIEQWSRQTREPMEIEETYTNAGRVAETYRAATVGVARAHDDPDILAAELDAVVERVVRDEIAAWDDPIPVPPAPTAEPLPPLPPQPDFHRAVAMLKEHPAVLRDLGLIFDLSVDAADLDVGDPGERWLKVGALGALGDLVHSPWVRYDLQLGPDAQFWPASATGSRLRLHRGLLDLKDSVEVDPGRAPSPGAERAPQWAVTTVDVDGAVSSLCAAARALRTAADDRKPTMPGARSAGLLLVRPGREADFEERADAAATRARNASDSAELTAEDLVLGYRVDIRTGQGPWRSLCEREVAYRVRDPDTREMLVLGDGERFWEEGHVKPFPAVRTADRNLHADEVVVRWDGWSLALPRVNLIGDTVGSARNAGVALPYEFTWDFGSRPGRLPRLRFAERYRMRVRLVDIAGGGPELGDYGSSNTGASTGILYTRYDPVRPPELHSHTQVQHDDEQVPPPGTAVDRLVIRSDRDMSAAEMHAAVPDYPESEHRLLRQPTVPLAIVEQHGVLDGLSDEESWPLVRRALWAESDGGLLPDPVVDGVSAYLPVEPGGLDQPIRATDGWPSWPTTGSKEVVLEEAPTGGPPISLRWDRGTLKVKLAPARQATLELSSTIQYRYLNHFPAWRWLKDAHVSTAASENGRNPLLSPVRRVQLVHAVRRPLVDPAWTLPEEQVRRYEGDTTALLHPTFDSRGLDPNSTGRLDVAARWDEWSDSGKHPTSVDHLHSETIDRGDPPAMSVRHELGDTKHRRVTYRLKATTRFRHYFDPDEPDDAFEVGKDQEEVTILSTARPPEPTVSAVVPAFHWQTQDAPGRVEQTRSPRLRVELARPWYETGEGERLGVIVATGSPPREEVADMVTEMGRDPIVASRTVPHHPPAGWFAGLAGAVAEEAPPERDEPVTVLPYAVTSDHDRWYADIDISPPDSAVSYGPFVRLAVARYQPDSLPSLRLSPIVRSDDMVRLLPTRRLVAERDGTRVRVSVNGVGPSPPNRIDAVLEHCELPAGLDRAAVDLVRIKGDPTSHGVPAWRAVPGHTAEGNQTETLTIALPRSPGPFRVRVQEVERIATVADAGLPGELRERVVFVGLIMIPDEWLRP